MFSCESCESIKSNFFLQDTSGSCFGKTGFLQTKFNLTTSVTHSDGGDLAVPSSKAYSTAFKHKLLSILCRLAYDMEILQDSL